MPKPLDYHVIATGSKGNAVRIGRIMMDCGIPFKRMKDDLYMVDTLLITHAHGDHVHPATLDSIREEFPRIKVYGNADVAYRWQMDVVVGTVPIKLPKKRMIIPFDCVHDVPCTGYLIQMDGMNIVYATDTSIIDVPDCPPLDYVFLESNYDEVKLRETAKRYATKNYDPYASSLRHLSTQKCKEFYFVNRRARDSPLIELHQSSRFY